MKRRVDEDMVNRLWTGHFVVSEEAPRPAPRRAPMPMTLNEPKGEPVGAFASAPRASGVPAGFPTRSAPTGLPTRAAAPPRVGGDDAPVETVRRDEPKVGRNDPCPCGSGKYKNCPEPGLSASVARTGATWTLETRRHLHWRGRTYTDLPRLSPRRCAAGSAVFANHPSQVDVTSRFTRNIQLNVPIASAAMDTVTESALAIAMAQHGGIGVIHKNLSIEEQASEVDRVKRSESGMIVNPITLSPERRIYEALELMKKYAARVPIPREREAGRSSVS